MRQAIWNLLTHRLSWLILTVLVVLAAGVWYRHHQQQAILRQATVALADRQYDKARDLLQQYLASQPRDAQALLLSARVNRRLREYFEAYEDLRRCKKAGGDSDGIDIETALIEIQRGEEVPAWLNERAALDDEEAMVILEVLIQHHIDTYRLWDALRCLSHYLRNRPTDLQALLARGFVWERFLYFSDALVDYRKAVEFHPENERARLKLAQTLLLAGTPNQALEHFQWLAKRRPEQPEISIGLAECLRRLGKLKEACGLLDAILIKAPENAEALWQRGQLELDLNNPATAEQWIRKAVKVNPNDRRMAHSLSRTLVAQGREEEAKKVNARVAEIDADLRRLDEIRQAVMKKPNEAGLRCEGGLLFLRNGEKQEGIRWLRYALRLDPNCSKAKEVLHKLDNP